jgi:hypothetical protein
LGIKIGCPEAAADEVDSDCLSLFVGEGEDCLRRLAIDELNTEDLCAWEGRGDGDSEVQALRRVFDLLYYLMAVSICFTPKRRMSHDIPLPAQRL